jgi:rod shape-determining protein MreC
LKASNLDHSLWLAINSSVVGILALIAFVRQDYSSKDVSYFEGVMIEAFAPLQRKTLSFKESVTSFFDHYIFIVNTSKENRRLENEISALKSKIFSLAELEKENERLKKLLDFGEEIKRNKVLAQVVSLDSSNQFKVLRINKGEKHGLQKLDPVITTDGLVGYVYKVSQNYADILTILDQNNRVDVIVSRTRSHGILEGIAKDKCLIKYVARTEQVELGDDVITAGLGNIYPKGLRVGKITKIDKENYGVTQSIELTPSVDFNKLEEVVVFTLANEAAEGADND